MDGILERKVQADSIDRLNTISNFMSGKTICALSDACAMPVTGFVTKFKDELTEYLAKGAAK